MKIAMIIVRTLMGLLFVASSVPFFLGLMPPPPPDAPAALKAFGDIGYLINLVKITELVCGLLFLSGYYVPLATILIAPVIVNIFLINLLYMPAGLVIAIPMVLANCFIAYYYWASYGPLLRPTMQPE